MKSATLAELATAHPAASRVFHRHGLDFCCGGRRPLADACSERGLDEVAIMDEIEQESGVESGERWDERPIPELVDFIVRRYHDTLRVEIPELVALAEKVEKVHADKATCPRGLAEHLRNVQREVSMHLAKEENVLFPMIVSGMASMAAGPIRVMEAEHDDHRESLLRNRALTANLTAPPEACTTWRALYLRLDALEGELMEHIHLENNVLFPRVLNAD